MKYYTSDLHLSHKNIIEYEEENNVANEINI